MAKQKNNRYIAKAHKTAVIGAFHSKLDTKGNVKNTLLETGKDLLIGVLGGGIVGAAIGKPSLLIGLGVTGLGHYTDSRLATLLGVGLMASNGFQPKNTVAGLDGLDGVKDRLQTYKDSFVQKLYLDKVLQKATPAVSGIGELQYFNYGDYNPPLTGGLNDADDLSGGLAALDNIQQQIEDAGMARAQFGNMQPDLEGSEDMEGTGDITDYNF